MSFRAAVLVLRSILLLAVACLFALSGGSPTVKLALLALLAISMAGLAALPHRFWRHRHVLALVAVFDLGLLTLVLYWGGQAATDFYLAYFLLLPLVAVAGNLVWVGLGAAAVVAAYGGFLFLETGGELFRAGDLLGRFPFLFVVGIIFGLLANRARQLEREARKLRELNHWISRLARSFSGNRREALLLIRGVLDDLHDSFPGALRASLVGLQGSAAEVLLSSDDPELDALALDLSKYPELIEASEEEAPLAIDDIQRSSMTSTVRDHLQEVEFCSLLLCPVRVQLETVGFLLLRVASTERGFSGEEREYCHQLATSIAGVVERAFLRAVVNDASDKLQLHRTIVETIPIGISVWRRRAGEGAPGGCFQLVDCNSAAEQFLSVRAGAESVVMSECLGDLDTSWLEEVGDQALVGGEPRDLGHIGIGEAVVAVKVFPLVNDQLGLVFEDVTERKEAEEELRRSREQLRQSQKMEAIGRLAGSVAHDFNNLLSAIGGYASLTLDSIGSDHPVREDVEQIVGAVDRASALTQQLLTFSRKQVLQAVRVDLNDVIADVGKLLERLVGEWIELDVVTGDIGSTKADPNQLAQVLMNLVVNARDAMPQGGRLEIRTFERQYSERFDVSGGRGEPGAYVILEVTDTGVGMSGDVQEQIFEPFFTTKKGSSGTGLGLATVYGIVHQSGGHIRVRSEEGEGTTFRVFLPRFEDDAEEAEEEVGPVRTLPAQSGPGAEARPQTVLVVEDEEAVRDVTSRILQNGGYRVLTAETPESATRICSDHQGHIDLLLTDVMLPGIDGVTLAERLSEVRPDLATVFMSGYPDNQVVRNRIQSANLPFVAKPFTSRNLMAAVGGVLQAR